MRVLLTGASGFVGKALTSALQARGHEVVPVTHRAPRPGEVGADLSEGRLDPARLRGGEIGEVDAVVHLAGASIFTRWTATRREQIRASRIAFADLIVRDIADWPRPPAVFVSGSAVGYYGERGEEELDESSAPGEGFLADVCRSSEAAASGAERYGTRVVAVRSGIVLGKGGGSLSLQRPVFRLGLGGKLGSGRQWTSWISLEDEVAAILFAIDNNDLEGPLNAVGPNPVRNSEYTSALARILDRPALFTVPAVALRLALGATADEMLLVSERVVPAKLQRMGFRFIHPTLEAALTAALVR